VVTHYGSRGQPSTKFEDRMPVGSGVISYNILHWIALIIHLKLLCMQYITWPMRGEQIYPTYLKFLTPICLFTVHLLKAMITFKGHLQTRILPLAGFHPKMSKIGPKRRFSGKNSVSSLHFGFVALKRHIFTRNCVFWHILHHNLWGPLGYG